jgi:hypothetical protein
MKWVSSTINDHLPLSIREDQKFIMVMYWYYEIPMPQKMIGAIDNEFSSLVIYMFLKGWQLFQ